VAPPLVSGLPEKLKERKAGVEPSSRQEACSVYPQLTIVVGFYAENLIRIIKNTYNIYISK
jgi:hypothetical protein